MRACIEDDADDLYAGPEIARPRREDALVVPNVRLRGKPLLVKDIEFLDDTPLDSGAWHGEVATSVSQGSRLTFGSRFISKLAPRKRERLLDRELGHDDHVLPGASWGDLPGDNPPEAAEQDPVPTMN